LYTPANHIPDQGSRVLDFLLPALLTAFILIAAMLYASVGHAGATAYLAAMALFGLAPEVMRPTALALNILVASIGAFKFYRAGHFSWPFFWPFAVASVPFAYLGGSLALPGSLYRIILGLVLLFAAYRMVGLQSRGSLPEKPKRLPLISAMITGGAIGLLAGLTGIGGGIILSPLIIFFGLGSPRQAAGISAMFILVNSLAGLLGHLPAIENFHPWLPFWALAAALGGWLGAEYGSRRLGNQILLRLLAIVLVIAGLRMVLQL
jgi:uncharacterized protein